MRGPGKSSSMWGVSDANRGAEGVPPSIQCRVALSLRRLGEMMKEQKETVGLAQAGRPKEIGFSNNPIVASAGIDKNLAHRGLL
jgi:hypothetical protein